MQEIIEHKAVESYITQEFEKRGMAVGPFVGLLILKNLTPQEVADELAAMKGRSDEEVDKEVFGTKAKKLEIIHQWVLELGKSIPMFTWDHNYLCVSYGSNLSMDLGCPVFTEWLEAVVKHVAENDSLKDFTFQVPS